jgi:plasmid maintenance system antidote protein VapI
MTFQDMLDKKGISKYKLSKITGIPKTTIIDICSGRSDIEKCSARTVKQLAMGLGCTMEEIMDLTVEEDYLERGLPDFLSASIQKMKDAWYKLDHNIPYLRWDCDYCDLQSEINNAEVNRIISSEQAWYLRRKYLRIKTE